LIAETRVWTQAEGLLSPNEKNHFIFWLIFGLSPNLGLSDSLNERLSQKNEVSQCIDSVCGEQVFGGLLVNVGTFGIWLSWIQYLSCARYSINVRILQLINQL